MAKNCFKEFQGGMYTGNRKPGDEENVKSSTRKAQDMKKDNKGKKGNDKSY